MCIKQNILVFIFLFVLSHSTFAADYTLAEVSKHNTEQSCWIVIEKEVFDVTVYLKNHPAPKVILLKSCGKDVTEGFKTKKGMGEKHSAKAIAIKTQMKIGIIK